ncbi:ClpP/crotonase-like domain-containing protein [Tirmania nivea]|nr:ClpP/crotonase-like domain-containing protein [Tirmania nivea]
MFLLRRRLLLLRAALSRPYSLSTPPRPPTDPLIHILLPPPAGPGHIHLLLLHSLPTRNALSTSVLRLLHTHLASLAASHPSSSRGLIVASAHPTTSFCSGADLKERITFTPHQTTQFLASLRHAFTSLANLPMPTVSAINGPALGGGLELALATDFRVLGPAAVVGLPETKLAIIPGAGGTYRLPPLIGETAALDLILTGRRVAPDEALRLGIATRLAAPDTQPENALLMRRLKEEGVEQAWDPALLGALELMGEICGGGPLAVRLAKMAVKAWRGGEDGENMAYEGVVGTWDRDEALRAFREKRKPVFKGE